MQQAREVREIREAIHSAETEMARLKATQMAIAKALGLPETVEPEVLVEQIQLLLEIQRVQQQALRANEGLH
jgi:hypothetical protein